MQEDRPDLGTLDDLIEPDSLAPRRALVDEPVVAPDADADGPRRALDAARPRRVTKKRVGLGALAALLTVVVLAVALASYYLVRVNSALDQVKRDSYAPTNPNRPSAPQATGPQHPMTFVLMGSDTRGTDDARSDSLMVAYLPANRQHVYILSIPRDTYVMIPGYGKNKINAAYAWGKVPLTVQTLEDMLQVKMEHAAVVDFEGFIQLSEVVGGITVDNPQESWVKPYHFPAGKITIRGPEALAFVRQRHDLKEGDLTRALRQRLVIKGIVSKALSMGVIGNPAKFGELLDQVAKIITVDSELTNDVIRDTALSLRLGSGEDVRGLSIPLVGYDTVQGVGAVDLLDKKRLAELVEAMRTDTMDSYWDAHHDDPLIGQPTPSSKTSAKTSVTPTPTATPTR